MKVVKKGKGKTPWAGRKVTCQRCNSVIRLEEKDKLQLISDWRDGDYYQFKCPECRENVTIDATLMRGSLF